MTTPDEVAASLTVKEIDEFCREWTSGDPEFDEPDVMLKAICLLAKKSLSPPAGMVMVPREPTDEMIQAVTVNYQPHLRNPDNWKKHVAGIYRKMLSARERKE